MGHKMRRGQFKEKPHLPATRSLTQLLGFAPLLIDLLTAFGNSRSPLFEMC
jgi:hypothetical protein